MEIGKRCRNKINNHKGVIISNRTTFFTNKKLVKIKLDNGEIIVVEDMNNWIILK